MAKPHCSSRCCGSAGLLPKHCSSVAEKASYQVHGYLDGHHSNSPQHTDSKSDLQIHQQGTRGAWEGKVGEEAAETPVSGPQLSSLPSSPWPPLGDHGR